MQKRFVIIIIITDHQFKDWFTAALQSILFTAILCSNIAFYLHVLNYLSNTIIPRLSLLLFSDIFLSITLFSKLLYRKLYVISWPHILLRVFI
jgi:hypothetical protein